MQSTSENVIFNIGTSSSYNYSNNLTSTPSQSKTPASLFNGGAAGSLGGVNVNGSYVNSTVSSSGTGSTLVNASNVANPNNFKDQQNSYVEIQAQFEMSIELRKFINIDLFQRGYYQIRLAVKCANKQIPAKILVQFENTQSNNNLSDVMFPSCVIDEYAVSKTFLILYKNEEVNLDDHILFKVSVLLNAFNILESFEKLDLQLNVELWFTENDYRPASLAASLSNQNQPETFTSLLLSMSAANNANNNSTNANNTSANGQQSTSQNSNNSLNQSFTGTSTSSVVMQQLCCRTFKIKFDPRQGIHLQIPVIFDYFHLSAVMLTLHCTLLTLLPPVMLGSTLQRNLTLSSILFGKDISQFKNANQITPNLMNRAIYIHNQICSLLLASFENLQDHIIKMSNYLNEYQKKNLKLEYVNCQDKLKKICEIIQHCNDPETLDDLANTHVAQCSAENIMQWCVYLDNFSINDTIAPFLAMEYHNKRLKRFSESFFTKDVTRSYLQDYEFSDNYIQLYDIIRQSSYFQQMPEMIVCCDDLDGLPENMPIIFEENYVALNSNVSHGKHSMNPFANHSSSKSSNFILSLLNNSNSRNAAASINAVNAINSRSDSFNSKKSVKSNRKGSQSSSTENSTASSNSNITVDLTSADKKLHRRLKKKLVNSGDSFVENYETAKSITLVAYRKTDDYFNDKVTISTSSASSSTTATSPTENFDNSITNLNKTQTKLSLIKADLANKTPGGAIRLPETASAPSQVSMSQHRGSIKSAIETKIANSYAASASDLLFNDNKQPSEERKMKDMNDLSNGLNQIDLSFNTSNEESGNRMDNSAKLVGDLSASLNEEKTIDCKLTSHHENENAKLTATTSAPPDCSFKSRVLYESFRGKNSTLERPKRLARRSILNSNASSEDTASVGFTSENRKNSTVSAPNPLHNFDESKGSHNNETKIANILYANAVSSNKNTRGSIRSVSDSTQLTSVSTPSKQPSISSKTKLKKQLTINSDRQSLSSIVSESVYKFALAKEELKRQLVNKYQGNIYSEFLSLFCTAPYFYSELTPKLSPSQSYDSIGTALSSIKPKINKSTSQSTSMSIQASKKKLFSLFKSSSESNSNNKNNQNSENESNYDEENEEQDEDSINKSRTDNESSDVDNGIEEEEEKIHLIVCVHGLEGNSGDLRLIRTYLELALPGARMDFLMSEQNQESTFDDIEVMTEQLIQEINDHIDSYGIDPYRISFIGHSLGNLIVRSAVSHENFKPFVNRLHTYLSLSGPHLGTLYNPSGLINMGLWIMQKWKKSGSLLQLSLKDNQDLHKTFLYKLSKKPTFEYFKNVLLVSSPQDRYVPFHSARIEMCKAAGKDNVYGNVYREMVWNILKPLQENPNIVFKRYTSFHNLPSGTSNFIGRAAHIAVLDSELFVEKLILVSVAKYFR